MENKLKGGIGDKMTLERLSQKHKVSLDFLKKQLSKGVKVELEHTKDPKVAREIAMDHLTEDAKYYNKLSKMEAKEQMSDASGSFEAPMQGTPVIRRPISKIPNSDLTEATDSSISAGAAYDVPFGGGPKGRKNPLKIDGEESIRKSKAVQDKNFPKWGGPGGVFIKIAERCKKFPYCEQGDINAIEILRESIDEVSQKYGIPRTEVEKIVLNEIKDIFI